MSEKTFTAWHTLLPHDRDIGHSAREIERLMRLKNPEASFTPRDLVRRLERSSVFTLWRAEPLSGPETDEFDWGPPTDWRHIDAVIFARRSSDGDTPDKPAAVDELVVTYAAHDPLAPQTFYNGDPLKTALCLALGSNMFDRHDEPPFKASEMKRVRIPRERVAEFPSIVELITGRFEDPLTGDFICLINQPPPTSEAKTSTTVDMEEMPGGASGGMGPFIWPISWIARAASPVFRSLSRAERYFRKARSKANG